MILSIGISVLFFFIILVFVMLLSKRNGESIQKQDSLYQGSLQMITMGALGMMLLLMQVDGGTITFVSLGCIMSSLSQLLLYRNLHHKGFLIATGLFLLVLLFRLFITFNVMELHLMIALLGVAMLCAFWTMKEKSVDRQVQRELQRVMICVGLFFIASWFYLENAAWLTLRSLFLLASLYLVYITVLDFKEQFQLAQPQPSRIYLSGTKIFILFLISGLMLAVSVHCLSASSKQNNQVSTLVYRSHNENFDNLYVMGNQRLHFNMAWPMEESLIDTEVHIQIYNEAQQELLYEDKQVLERTSFFETGNYWTIQEMAGARLAVNPQDRLELKVVMSNQGQIISTEHFTLEPMKVPVFNGQGKYYTIENMQAGYGYSDGGEIIANNNWLINGFRFRNLCSEAVFYDELGNEILNFGSRGTNHLTSSTGVQQSSYALNFEDVEAVSGKIRIWMEDTSGNHYYEEEIVLVKEP